VKLEDVCELIVDCPHSTANDEGNGFPLIRTPNIGKGRLILEGVHRVSQEVYDKRNLRAVPQDDDLIFAREAPAGNVAVIKNGEKVCLGQRTVLLRPNKALVNPDFLAYYLLSPQQQYGLLGTANGATVAHVNIPTIRNLKIDVPDLDKQVKIAGIISAYDNLIENNQKQIKLLEEAAQRLYKEWFVDLRFPGYETTPVVDGVPEGWKWTQLADIAAVNKRSISKDYSFEYIDYIDIGSVSAGRIESKTRYMLKDAPGRAKRVVCDGDVIWGMVRPNLKSYALVFHPQDTTIASTGFAVLSAKKVPFSFLYCHVIQDEFISYLVNCTNGAAYPAVKPIHFEEANILVPTNSLLEKFQALAEPMFRKIEVLSKQIEVAAEARDRLLPKLMSGELEV
jgi:type I restriction enzyme S subunit